MRLFEGTPWDRPPRCERCGESEEECVCPPEPVKRQPTHEQTAHLSLEKRKKGKWVTVVRGLSEPDSDLSDLLTQLKSTCGAGGTLKQEALEIQGQQLARIRDHLLKLGYHVKG